MCSAERLARPQSPPVISRISLEIHKKTNKEGVILVISLSERLQCVANFVKPGAKLCDIGTDHGYLPVYLVQEGLCKSAIASDISDGSLEAARYSVEKYNVSEKVKIVLAAGLDGISEDEVDTIVIAGMGGETIITILSNARWTRNNKTLILQPQSKVEELIDYLNEHRYNIADVKLAQDDGRYYIIIKSEGIDFTPKSYYDILEILREKEDKHFSGYLDKQIRSLKRAIEGLDKSENPKVLEKREKLNRLLTL